MIFHEKTATAQQNQQIFHEKMDKEYQKERFGSLSIKRSIAKKFRGYSRSISKSQSMALLAMLEFFEVNGISPDESIRPQVRTLENLVKKRINSVIAILKDIEKTQTRPTAAMMQSLFEAAEPKKKPLMLERKPEDSQKSLKSTENNQNP